jgi:hypothetical protein
VCATFTPVLKRVTVTRFCLFSTFSFSMVKEGFIGISPFSFLSIFVLLFILEDFRTVGSRL